MTSIHHESNSEQIKFMTKTRHYQERSVPKFLKKVFSMLEEDSFSDYISWSEDGFALIIKRPTDFANNVLPNYFKHSNFSSFIRQLNMYKFKKSKNAQYDHIYTHQMFQRGRIDLLRNIQRKTNNTAEAVPLTPTESQSLNGQEEIDVDRLVQENMQYKRIHKELTTQVEFISNKMRDIKGQVSYLFNEQKKSETNEKYLKSILKSLTKAFGYENIVKVIENDVEEEPELPELNLQESLLQEEVYSKANNAGSHYDEDGSLEKCTQFSHQYSEHFSTSDTPQPSSHFAGCNKDDSLDRQPLFLLDFGGDSSFLNDNCVLPDVSPLSKANSYVVWVDELKNKESNSEMLFSESAKRFNGDLNIEDF